MSSLQVYAPLLALGTWMTLKLALLSLLLSLMLGLLGAGAKLSTSPALQAPANHVRFKPPSARITSPVT